MWRLGLLTRGEAFTKERYSACVQNALDDLKARRLLTPRVEKIYHDKLATVSLSQ